MRKVKENTYVCSLLQANVVNGNGRIYSPEALTAIMKQFGELDHPMYGELGMPSESVISLSRASHKINKLYISVNKVPRKKKKKLKKLGLYKRIKNSAPILWGEIEFDNKNTNGKLAEQLTKGLVARPRGFGTVDKDGVVRSDYKVISFDLISKEDDSFKNIL